MQREQAPLHCPPDHAVPGQLGDELREQGDEVDAHQKSGSQSTVTTPASRSTERTYCGSRNGIIRSRPLPGVPPCATSTSLAPVENRCDTMPKSTPSRLTTRRPSRSTDRKSTRLNSSH